MEIPLNAVFGVCLEGPLRPGERVAIPVGAASLAGAEQAPQVAGVDEWTREIERIRGMRSDEVVMAAPAAPDPVQAIKAALAQVREERADLNRRTDLGGGNSTAVWIFDPRNYGLNIRERHLTQQRSRLEAAAKQDM
jgi:hypothetical protein